MQPLWNLQEIIVNRIKKGIILAVVGIVSIFVIMNILKVKESVIVYEEGEKLTRNPDRGFYVQLDAGEKEKIECYEGEVRLFLLAFDLYAYRNEEIPPEKLEELAGFLEEAKQQKVRCIFRAAYGFEREECNDADSMERIIEHIRQIAPILNHYKNQICCVQAGFFGPWGEWHSSPYLEGADMGKENRNRLLQELLKQLEEDIVIDVRRPRFIRDAWDAGFEQSRIGFHNDGLLGSDTDLGTYDDSKYSRQEEMEWMKENLKTGLNGGEMPNWNEYSGIERAMEEFPKMKLSYLNLKYNEQVYEQWKSQMVGDENAFDYISKHLGYRLFISKVGYPVSLEKGLLWNRQCVEVVLQNSGFAPIGKGYELEWVVEDMDGNIHCFKEQQSLAEVESGEQVSIKLKAKLLKKVNAKKIGIRIYKKDDKEKCSEDCVELVNDELLYQDGVNQVLFVDEDGTVMPNQ